MNVVISFRTPSTFATFATLRGTSPRAAASASSTTSPTHRRHRTAFTLIELVASAVLAAMMMAGLMSIVWSASRDLRQLQQEETSGAPTTLLIDRMRTDFQNARGMQIAAEGIVLHGFLMRDPRTHETTWAEGRVVYRTIRVSGRNVLVRQQVGQVNEPMWVGAQRVTVESLEETDPEDALTPSSEAGGLPEVPGVFRVTLLDGRGQTLWREVIHHHEN